jgi:hypothetical protein
MRGRSPLTDILCGRSKDSGFQSTNVTSSYKIKQFQVNDKARPGISPVQKSRRSSLIMLLYSFHFLITYSLYCRNYIFMYYFQSTVFSLNETQFNYLISLHRQLYLPLRQLYLRHLARRPFLLVLD